MKSQIRSSTILGFALFASSAMAQNYVVIELPRTNGYAFGISNGTAVGVAGGTYSNSGRAVMWDSNGNISDLHPDFLDTPTTQGTSVVNSIRGSLMAGSGRGDLTSNRINALMWKNGIPSFVPMPTGFMSSQGLSTDGTSIVGQFVMPAKRGDFTTAGDTHGFVYNTATGQFTGMYNGNPSVTYGVSGNQQVGMELHGTFLAYLWNGNPKSPTVLHPQGAEGSVAYATDGVHQVGEVGYLVQKAGEANKKGIRIRYDYAALWSGSAASLQFLSSGYPNSFAMSVNGNYVAGYGIVTSAFGTRGAQHALGWMNPLEPALDLHSLLPAGYSQSWAQSVDANGNFAGYGVDSSNVTHALIWLKVS